MLADADFGGEGEVDHTLRRDIVEHVPRGFFIREAVFDVDVSDAAAAALFVEERTEAALLLNGAFLHERNPLIRVDEVFILLKEKIIGAADDSGAVLGGDHLDVEGEVALEVILYIVHGVEDLGGERNRLIRIALAAELVRFDQAEEIHHLIHADRADGAELFVKLNRAVLIVREKPLLDIALDDVAHGGERLTVEIDTLTQKLEILGLIQLALIGDAGKVDCADTAGADRQSRAADRVDESVQLLGVTEQTAAVGQYADVIGDEEVGVAPAHVVPGAPAGERLVLEFAVLIQQAVGQHRISEHIGFADLADNLHEHLLAFDQILNVVDGEGSVRELHTAEQGLKVRPVEDRHVRERGLVDSQEGLVEAVDELLELLAQVVVRIFHVVSFLNVAFPEVPRPDQDVRHTDGSALTVRQEGDELDHVVKICSEMLRGLVIVIGQEEQAFRGEAGEIVRPAVREVARGRAVVQVERTAELGFKPLACGAQPPHLLDLNKNLIEAEQLVAALAFLRHKAPDVFMAGICVRVNAGIGERLLVNEVVDELGVVELLRSDAVDNFKVVAILVLQRLKRSLKILIKFQQNIHILDPFLYNYCPLSQAMASVKSMILPSTPSFGADMMPIFIIAGTSVNTV